MVIVLAPEQDALLRQMAADVDVAPADLLVMLVSSRLEQERLDLWRA